MKTTEQTYGRLKALTLSSSENPSKALVLLHGVGSNEKNLLELGPLMTEDRLIVSMRAPIVMGLQSFAWFHVQFTERGPVHNWQEASESLSVIEEALTDLSKKSEIPLDKISIFGFSQGAIMTIGLALTSKLNLENYIASSGRTLPEFAAAAKDHPLSDLKLRRVYVTHGVQDSKLPIQLGRHSESILSTTALKLTYKEYNSEHTIAPESITDIKKWLSE